MAELKDSGSRREFDTGAVRDICEGKGRCDLLPLKEIGWYAGITEDKRFGLSNILTFIGNYIYTGNVESIAYAIERFINEDGGNFYTAILELSKHYEDGARKYSDRNWEKGIPVHCFVDSGVRHLLKWYRGDDDEPHDRAFLWNMFGIVWTMDHFNREAHPEIFDLPWCGEGYMATDKKLEPEKPFVIPVSTGGGNGGKGFVTPFGYSNYIPDPPQEETE